MTIHDLMSRTNAAEIALWRAFAKLEPIGPLRGDFQAGVVAAAIVNMLRGKKRRPATVGEFLYFDEAATAPPTRKARCNGVATKPCSAKKTGSSKVTCGSAKVVL